MKLAQARGHVTNARSEIARVARLLSRNDPIRFPTTHSKQLEQLAQARANLVKAEENLEEVSDRLVLRPSVGA